MIETFIQRLDDRSERLDQAFSMYWNLINARFETVSKLLKSYSYHSILDRGFALISGSSGQIIDHSQAALCEKRACPRRHEQGGGSGPFEKTRCG